MTLVAAKTAEKLLWAQPSWERKRDYSSQMSTTSSLDNPFCRTLWLVIVQMHSEKRQDSSSEFVRSSREIDCLEWLLKMLIRQRQLPRSKVWTASGVERKIHTPLVRGESGS